MNYDEEINNDGLIFYRCNLCKRVVSIWDLKAHLGCSYCGHARISPSNLTLWEKCKQIIKHPRVWEWQNVKMGD